ncbi:MAG: hypothetical protein KDB22_07960 [Planctomycetales bacterium]|nr:hypothetical protein [Planctomycetales bacterium]
MSLACSIALLLVFLTAFDAIGQDTPIGTDKGNWPDVLNEGVLDLKLRVWPLGEDGKPVFVPDSTLDEILKFRNQTSSTVNGTGLPNYNFSDISLTADAQHSEDDRIADIQASFGVEIGASDSLATVQLRLDSCRTTQQPEIDTPAVSYFRASSKQAGYEWLINGTAQSRHRIKIFGKSNVIEDAGRYSLRFSLPLAPASIRVLLPANAIDARTRSEDVIETSFKDDAVVVDIVTNGGEVTLSWQLGRSEEQFAAVAAKSSTVYSIRDPSQPWEAITELNLRWYGTEATEKLLVTLPVGGRLRTLPTADIGSFRISRIRSASDEPMREQLQIENYAIDQSQVLTLALEWDWAPVITESRELSIATQIPVPKIEGVDAHRGTVDCQLPSIYSVTFDSSSDATLIRQIPADDVFAKKQLRFEFSDQDYQLEVVLRREQSLPIVRPTYHLRVDENKMVLTAWLSVSFDANQYARELRLNLADSSWLLQENTARIVDPEAPLAAGAESLSVRRVGNDDGNYVITAPSYENIEFNGAKRVEQMWRFVAERRFNITRESDVTFPIPQVIRGAMDADGMTDSGTLIVTAATNVSLRQGNNTGLLADSFSSEYEKFLRDSTTGRPLVFRIQPLRTIPQWHGLAERLPQSVSLAQRVEFEVASSQVAVRHEFELNIANVPLDQLTYAVRQDEDEFQPLQVFLNGSSVSSRLIETLSVNQLRIAYPQLMDPSTVSDAVGDATEQLNQDDRWNIYLIQGVSDLIGVVKVELRSAVSWDEAIMRLPGQELLVSRLSIPLTKLLVPSETIHLGNNYQIKHGLRIEVLDAGSNSMTVSTSGTEQPIYSFAPGTEAVSLELRVDLGAEPTPIRIEQVYLQTAYLGGQRHDWYAARFTSSAREIRIQLPKFIDLRRVLINSAAPKKDYVYDKATETLIVETAPITDQEQVIEVLYTQQEELTWATRIEVKSPQIFGAKNVEGFNWRLIVPAIHHLAWCPTNLNPEWQWTWGGLYWKRTSNDSEFDRMFGGSMTRPVSSNRYLMSGYGSNPSAGTWVFSRMALWMPVGSLAILLVYCIWNFSAFRTPIAMAIYALIVTSLATLWPDFALLVAQTSVISLSLVVLFLATQVAIDSRVRRRSVFTSRPSSTLESMVRFSGSKSFPVPPPAAAHAGSSIGAGGGG